MKLLSFITLTALSLSALAGGNSELEPRHLKVIERAIKDQCHLRKITPTKISTEARENRIDQGVIDFDYITYLEVKNEFDQGQYDLYSITVISHYTDAYDHHSRVWGIYSISSVKCDLN